MKRAILTVKETSRDNNAGPKAKLDIEKYLMEDGFTKWNFVINQKSILQKAKVAYLDVPAFFAKNKDVDEIFLQYPTYSKIVTNQLIKRLKKLHSKVFLIVDYIGSICFAGNLNKAGFLRNLSLSKATLNVFGPNPAESYGQNVSYRGQYSPDELPVHLAENFGLVWDGTTPTTCDGLFGNYMKFNNPHKASLYLSSGIPVIIWRQAALADFIEKNKLGLAIDSLNDLDEVLANISTTEYKNFIENTRNIASKLRDGSFIKKAIHNLELKVGGNE